jgi:hypothetical protein
MAKENNNASGGIGFTGLLQLLFIAFKLLKVINWPWIWILAPLWIAAGLVVLIVIIFLIVQILK